MLLNQARFYLLNEILIPVGRSANYSCRPRFHGIVDSIGLEGFDKVTDSRQIGVSQRLVFFDRMQREVFSY